ncbi:MAG: T9SS type A sorting domain-containing protein [Flavobacteriales bacterium]|mgnify:FL=1|nr:T9SS type A sorting domain-containing protein [Flavobacteriales bacterium]MBK6945034.1 T9SS type A sorting domain-containing protein [Flavobacteriales bacterium]MBK7239383.1 T9SS type A sorting domain-containing protein [Flavobacteriales bacterium]MBK7295912.1 T9SS type A sorting domain-containing protein [Flavobacteriales bacterium]MBK9535411.1 T9SS type A sorting domain-containing protein [Flavobacteriales bacterium]
MYRSILSCAAFAVVLFANAQLQVRQVFALSEGYFDYANSVQVIPVTLGSYDPGTGMFQTVATLTGPRFGSDVLVDGATVFVAADDRIVKYSADDYTELDLAMVQGVRKLAIWNDKLLLTRGELGGLDHYFEVRDKNTLDLLWSIDPVDGLTRSAEDVVVLEDKAYLGVNNAFDWANLSGIIGEVDLLAQTYGQEVDLGPAGLNPEKLFVVNGMLHSFNNTDFSKSSISTVDPQISALQGTTDVTSLSSCAASVVSGDNIYFLEYAQNELARYSISNDAVLDTLFGSPAVYGIVEDDLNNVLYATTTDFSSTGELLVLDLNGTILSSVPASVSCGNLAVDTRSTTGIGPIELPSFNLFPNPADDSITIQLPEQKEALMVVVLDATGRTVLTTRTQLTGRTVIDIDQLVQGVYTVSIADHTPIQFTKF